MLTIVFGCRNSKIPWMNVCMEWPSGRSKSGGGAKYIAQGISFAAPQRSHYATDVTSLSGKIMLPSWHQCAHNHPPQRLSSLMDMHMPWSSNKIICLNCMSEQSCNGQCFLCNILPERWAKHISKTHCQHKFSRRYLKAANSQHMLFNCSLLSCLASSHSLVSPRV